MTDKTNVFTALIKAQPHFLDRPLSDLLPLRFMGEVAVNAYRGLIKRLDDLPLSLEEKESRLRDGQDAGRALLTIEARIGELLPSAKEAMAGGGGKLKGIPKKEWGQRGDLKVLPLGIKPKQATNARAIASHPREVEEVIKEAVENEDIPTKTAVLNKIAYKQELARTKDKREKTQLEMSGEAYIYYSRLEEACRLIPTKPPRELRERDFLQIKAIALLIIKRLEVFNEQETEGSTGSDRKLSQGKR